MSISSISGTESLLQSYKKDKTRQNVQGNSGPSDILSLVGASTTIGSNTTASATPDDSNDPVKDFTDYMKKTPAQRMQEAWLKQHGITQQQFDAMSPAEKQKLIDEMKREMEAKLKQKMDVSGPTATTDILI